MTLWQTLFGFEGRVGRITLWLSGLAILLLDISVLLVVSGWVRAEYLTGVPHRPGGAVVGAGLGLLAITALSVWTSLALKVKRCHDRDRSGWWLLIALTGIGAVWLFIELGFLPGSRKRNRFDEPLDAPAVKAAPVEASTQNWALPEHEPEPTSPPVAVAAAAAAVEEPFAVAHDETPPETHALEAVEPAPVEAEPVEPEPAEPEHVEPEPIQPAVHEPEASEPEHAEPPLHQSPQAADPADLFAAFRAHVAEPAHQPVVAEPEPPQSGPLESEPVEAEHREPLIEPAVEPQIAPHEPEPVIEPPPATAPHPVMVLGGVTYLVPTPPPEPEPEPPAAVPNVEHPHTAVAGLGEPANDSAHEHGLPPTREDH